MSFAPKRQYVALRKHDVFMNAKRIILLTNLNIKSTSGLSCLMHGFITLSDMTFYGQGDAKTRLISYASTKGADQSAHPSSLISTFAVRC